MATLLGTHTRGGQMWPLGVHPVLSLLNLVEFVLPGNHASEEKLGAIVHHGPHPRALVVELALVDRVKRGRSERCLDLRNQHLAVNSNLLHVDVKYNKAKELTTDLGLAAFLLGVMSICSFATSRWIVRTLNICFSISFSRPLPLR